MSFYEMIISFVIGMITGCVTGVLVTNYYRKKDQKESKNEKTNKEFSIFMNYLEDILTEVEIIRKNPHHTYVELERLIKKKNIRYKVLPGIFGGNDTVELKKIIQILLNFERMIDNKNIDLDKIQEGLKEISMLMIQVFLQRFPKQMK